MKQAKLDDTAPTTCVEPRLPHAEGAGDATVAPPEPIAADCAMTIHAVFPPPVTGMSLCTEAVATLMARRVPVERYNWSQGSARITNQFRVAKAARALLTPVRLLFGRRSQNAVFYMPCNAGFAVIFNVLALLAARVRGYRCALHHHFYRYLDRFQWRIQLLAWVMGPNDLQIVLCPDMEHRLRKWYGGQLAIAIIPSTIQLLAANFEPKSVETDESASPKPFRIGHICNLQMAKGLDTVVDVLRELRQQGRDVQLVLAGPVQSSLEQSFIEAAQREFGSYIDYRGPVYGEEKLRFFRDVQVKLFPTRYPDAQPLVITESFAFGCPVISYGRGCIPGMMAASPHWSIPPCEDFVSPAIRQIDAWMDDAASYAEARRVARGQFDVMMDAARKSLTDFESWIYREPVPGFVHRGAECPLVATPSAV